MAATYTNNLKLTRPAFSDRGWDVSLNGNANALDALMPVGGLAVALAEVPSTSLNVAVAAGRFRQPDGTEVSYAGTASQSMTGSATNYVYLTTAGVLTVSTSAFPTTIHCPLAIVVAGSSTITSITDRRSVFACVALGGPWLTVVSPTTAYTATAADGLIRADATGAAFQVTLPAATGLAGKVIHVKRVNTGANNVTVAVSGGGTIDGAATKTLGAQYSALAVVSNGSAWGILSTYGTVS